MTLASDTFTMNSALDAVIAAVEADVCRHCGNARCGSSPTLCTECGRCSSCGDSPNCALHDSEYDGDECRFGITEPPEVASTLPLDHATGITRHVSTCQVFFTRQIDIATCTTGSIKLVNVDGGSVGLTFTSPTNPFPEEGPSRYVNINWVGDLTASTHYYFDVTSDVKDVAGNPAVPYRSIGGFATGEV